MIVLVLTVDGSSDITSIDGGCLVVVIVLVLMLDGTKGKS